MLDWKPYGSDGPEYPHGDIDTATHQLERPRTWAASHELSCLHPAVYSAEFATRELVERASVEIALRATALYSYTRFDSECLSDSAKAMLTSFEHYPEGAINTVKHKTTLAWAAAHRLLCRFTRWATRRKRIIGLPNFPRRLLPKLSSREIVTWEDRQVTVERVQESLLAQIALFHKYNLKPQAVLVHPSMASELAAARTMGERYHQQAASVGGQTTFAGLPVVACPELAQGAMVV